MKKNGIKYVKSKFFPLLLYSLVTGILTGAIIYLFKIASSYVISLSGNIFGYVRDNLAFLPLLILGAAALGLLAALILQIAPESRGGGIPSAIAALRGQVPIKRIVSLPLVFIASLLTYVCGVPLGTEGPAVQMGTLVGWTTSRVFGRKNRAWHRYIMTGGACAGFASATGAPLTGIFFAFEEAHRRFTPLIFMSASLTVAVSSVTMELLCSVSGISSGLFGFTIDTVMGIKYLWVAPIIGIVCGIVAVFFTKAYRTVNSRLGRLAQRLPFALRIVIIFVLVALIGVALEDCIGTGHHTVDMLIEGEGVWYLLLIVFLVRAALLMISNTQGVTGGLFIPTLAFGAMIGALCGKGMTAAGLLPGEYLIITVVIGMTSFLAASSRVPLTALAFALEALSGATNFLPISIGIAISFAVIEIVGVESFNDTGVDIKIEERNRGREIIENDVELIVQKGAFVSGQEIRDILWPPDCVVVSVIKAPGRPHGAGLDRGDLLCIHYRTAHPEFIAERLEELLGKQSYTD